MKRRANGEGSISQLRDGRWRGSIMVRDHDGRRVRKYVYGRTQAEAIEKLQEFRERNRRGQVGHGHPTVREVLDTWLHVNERRQGVRAKDLNADYHEKLVARIGDVRIDRLTAARVEDAIADVKEEAAAHPASRGRGGVHTANKVLGFLKSALDHVVRVGLLPANPAASVVTYRSTPTGRRQLWTNDETKRFLKATDCHRLSALFYLAIGTGMRSGELLALQWHSITSDSVIVAQGVTRTRAKTEIGPTKTTTSNRRIRIDHQLMEKLEGHRARQAEERELLGLPMTDDTFVFTNQDGAFLSAQAKYHVWRKLLESAQVPRITFHDLRHLHASMLIAANVPITVISARLGHATPATTLKIYAHEIRDHQQAGALSLDELLN